MATVLPLQGSRRPEVWLLPHNVCIYFFHIPHFYLLTCSNRCKCRAEFCYLCGLQWKTCECVIWDERRLVARAAEVVDRQALAPLEPQIRHMLVQRMRANLVENHECEHQGRFRRVEGSRRRAFDCEICGERHRKYILECRQCQIVVCESCRRNRI